MRIDHMDEPKGYDLIESYQLLALVKYNAHIEDYRHRGFIIPNWVVNKHKWMIELGFVGKKKYGNGRDFHFVQRKWFDYNKYTFWLKRQFKKL